MNRKITKKDYELSMEITRIGNRALCKAHEENHKKGLHNIISRNNKIYFELADGTITTDNPLE